MLIQEKVILFLAKYTGINRKYLSIITAWGRLNYLYVYILLIIIRNEMYYYYRIKSLTVRQLDKMDYFILHAKDVKVIMINDYRATMQYYNMNID